MFQYWFIYFLKEYERKETPYFTKIISFAFTLSTAITILSLFISKFSSLFWVLVASASKRDDLNCDSHERKWMMSDGEKFFPLFLQFIVELQCFIGFKGRMKYHFSSNKRSLNVKTFFIYSLTHEWGKFHFRKSKGSWLIYDTHAFSNLEKVRNWIDNFRMYDSTFYWFD